MLVAAVIFSVVTIIVVYRLREQSVVYRGLQTYYLVLAVLCLVLAVVALLLL